MPEAIHLTLLILRAFCRVDGKDNHKGIQLVCLVVILDNEGIGPVELTGGSDNRIAVAVGDFIVPVEKVALDSPVFVIERENRLEEGKLLFDTADFLAVDYNFKAWKKGEDFFADSAEMCPVSVENIQLVSKSNLTFYSINGLALLVVNIVTVKPGKKASA